MSEGRSLDYEWNLERSEVVSACIDYAVGIGQRLVANNINTHDKTQGDVQGVVDQWIDGIGEWGSAYESQRTDSPPPSILQFLKK